MNLKFLDFDRGNCRQRVSDDKVYFRRQIDGRNLDDRNAVNLANYAVDGNLCCHVAPLDEVFIQLNQIVESRRNYGNSATGRSLVVVKDFLCAKESCISVGRCNISRRCDCVIRFCVSAGSRSRRRQNTKPVGINRRNQNIVDVLSQCSCSFHSAVCILLSLSVDDIGERLVLRDCHFLIGVSKVCRSAVSGCAGSAVVVQCSQVTAEHTNSLNANPVIVVVAKKSCGKASKGKPLVNLTCVFQSIIDCAGHNKFLSTAKLFKRSCGKRLSSKWTVGKIHFQFSVRTLWVRNQIPLKTGHSLWHYQFRH